jgi:putative sterol carrier protein
MGGCDLASKDAVKKGLEKVKLKFEDKEVQNAFKGVSKRVQFVYPDIHFSCLLEITDGKVRARQKSFFSKPDVFVSMTSDTFLSIQNKELTGRDALAQGKIQITGVVGDLFLLEKYLAN